MKKRFGIKSAILVTLLVLAGVVAVFELTNTTHWFHSASDNSGINYGPPTQAEINDSESRKSNPPTQTDTNTSSPTPTSANKKRVTPEITTFAQKSSTFNVNGFVNGVVESGGTCTLTLTSTTDSSNKVSQSRSSEANATNTTCGVISVPLSKLSKGTWNAVLSYSSNTATGLSDVTPMEVN